MIKVNQLAKELRISTAALKKHLNDMGVVVRSHMSPIDDETVKNIRAKFNKEFDDVKKRQHDRNTFHKKIVLADRRNKIIRDLIAIYNYPPQRIISEPEIKFGNKIAQPDIVVYEDNDLRKAFLVIEIKQYLTPELQKRTQQQILQYGAKINAKFGIIILPTSKYCYTIENNLLYELEEIPFYDEKKGYKKLSSNELQIVKPTLTNITQAMFGLAEVVPVIGKFLFTAILLKRAIDVLNKDKYTIIGMDFLEEQKEIILNSEIKDFIKIVRDYFNLKENKDFKLISKQYKKYPEKNDLIIISDKINILEQIQRLINEEESFHSQDFLKFLYENREKIKLNIEQEIANARIEERNKIMASLSHSIKNMLRSAVIMPLIDMKQDEQFKMNDINNAIKGANLIREIVNAMNLSYKGSFNDFIFDAEHPSTGSMTFSEIVIKSLKYSIGNMFDSVYFSEFVNYYFPTEKKYFDTLSIWKSVSKKDNLKDIVKFMNKYLMKTNIDISSVESLSLGNSKGSALKIFIMIQEIILNAIKYSCFIPQEKRNFKFSINDIEDKIIVTQKNNYKPKTKTKTTGLGHIVVENFAKLLDAVPIITKHNNEFSLTISFKNFWRKNENNLH